MKPTEPNLITLYCFVLAGLLHGQNNNLQTQLDQLRSSYERTVQNLGAGSTTDLDAKYTAAVQRTLSTASETDKAELQTELTRLGEKQPLPSDDSDAGPTLKKLRSIYRQQLQPLAAQREKATSDLKTRYLAELKKLGSTLKKGSPEMALIDTELANAGTSARLSGSVAKLPELEASRRILEWALNQPDVEVETTAGIMKLGSEMPKGRFTISSINHPFGSDSSSVGFPWELLPSLPTLRVLEVKTTEPFTAAQISQLQHLPALSRINLRGTFADDSALNALPAKPELTGLCIYAAKDGASPRDHLDDLLAKYPNIWSLHWFDGRDLTDAEAPALWSKVSRWGKLRRFYTGHNLTQSMADHLGKLGIDAFQMDARTDPAALARFVGLKEFRSSWRIHEPGICAALSQIIDIETLHTPAPPVKPDEILLLKNCKKLRQLVFSRPFNSGSIDAARHLVPALAGLTQLSKLSFASADLRDEDLLTLTALKNLTFLHLKGCTSITPAGIAAFSKKLPRCEVTAP